MILARDFVFLHVPKTGGSFVGRVLEEHAPPEWDVDVSTRHESVRDIPPDRQHLPRLAFVRNPFAWYVSWYSYLLHKNEEEERFQRVSRNRTLGFRDTIRNLFAEEPVVQRTGEGPFTQFLKEFLGPGLEGIRVGKMENLRQDLLQMLRETTSVPDLLANAILTHPPTNVSRHHHYSRLYDAELRDLVARHDRLVLDHFGYRFEERVPRA